MIVIIIMHGLMLASIVLHRLCAEKDKQEGSAIFRGNGVDQTSQNAKLLLLKVWPMFQALFSKVERKTRKMQCSL